MAAPSHATMHQGVFPVGSAARVFPTADAGLYFCLDPRTMTSEVSRVVDQRLLAVTKPNIPSIRDTKPRAVDVQGGIRDNGLRGSVADFLRERVAPGSTLSVVSAYFTVHAYGELAGELDAIDGMRFLFGDPGSIRSIDCGKSVSKSFRISDDGIKLDTQLSQRALSRKCANWIKSKVEIRATPDNRLIHGKLYHVDDGREPHAILGSSNLTMHGLGLSRAPNVELNIIVDSRRDRDELKRWFEELWSDSTDVKQQVLDYIATVYGNRNPEFVYFKTLFHIFERFLSEQSDTSSLFARTEIVDTQVWGALFDFQKDGVKGAIRKIQTHNGCILADSVGLGKTFCALAVIKYFELRNHRVLVLCPKRLRDNWTMYLAYNNSEMNPFLKDRFSYTVLSHTDLSRERGKVDSIDLATLNWGNFDLVVIDESHNFRNDVKGRRDAEGNIIRKSRYERLLTDIIKSGVKTKVMLLSATPVNNDLKDLRNQIAFITEQRDNAFAEHSNIHSINGTLAVAQKNFSEWAKQSQDRDVRVLLEKLPPGFFTILDELTIARSRRHIQKFYSTSLVKIGPFPKRHPPESIFAEIDANGRFPSYDAIHDAITSFQLSLYSPSAFVQDEFKEKYLNERYRERGVPNFSQGKHEQFLIGMMKVNFLKRLESSVHAFAITMQRTVEKISVLEERLRLFKKRQVKSGEALEFATVDELADDDEELAEAFQVGANLKYEMRHLRVDDWLNALAEDKAHFSGLAKSAQRVDAARDAKLATLWDIIAKKVNCPTINRLGEKNRKVIVFCAFADTAAYLYEHLEQRVRSELGVHIALVSGGTKPNRATFGRAEFAEILTHFSPRSKNREKMGAWIAKESEIDILIATDCISEGQNLQDCDLLINYDIHWNPVRIIQRFGRIDRLGSVNDSVRLVNFWPTPDLNKYINLKNRVEARMALVDISATAGDNLLQTEEIQELIHHDLRYRDKQLLRLRNEVLDLEDFSESVSLSEFSLDDFRMDLDGYVKQNGENCERFVGAFRDARSSAKPPTKRVVGRARSGVRGARCAEVRKVPMGISVQPVWSTERAA